MTDQKDSLFGTSDISHLQTYHCENSSSALSALASLEQLLDVLEMTAAELEEMCGEDLEGEDLL